MKKLKEILFLSDKGYTDLKKAIIACTITNLAMLLPFCITVMVFSELLNPFLGQELDWQNIWLLWGAGIISAIIVFLASKNDYRKTYIASYKESNVTRLRIAEHLRKLPMSFFNTKDLSELTTNMMSDCSSMESMLSSTIPPLIANGISVTLTCVLLALFDWRLALCVFITLPIAFLVIWCSRKYQIKLFEKQVETKLNASSQVQEYLEGIKIIKSCNLSGVHFRTLNRALLEMKKIAVKVEMVVGIFMSSAMGNPNATKEQVYKAAKVAYCDEFVRNLPNGYDTILGENGSTLSGGERQRISIARALLKDSPIILLDEATASLDPENEVFVQKALAYLIKGKTVIMIAHRLRTVVDADQILVMENGKIVEHGTHNELMERKGLYHKLYSIQQESLGWSV